MFRNDEISYIYNTFIVRHKATCHVCNFQLKTFDVLKRKRKRNTLLQ